MKTFDLIAAINGEYIIARSGTSAKIECYYPYEKVLHVTLNGKITLIYNDQGICLTSINEDNDLFMAHKKKKLWIAILKDNDKNGECSIYPHAFNSCERLNLSIFLAGTYRKDECHIIEIEIDEE